MMRMIWIHVEGDGELVKLTEIVGVDEIFLLGDRVRTFGSNGILVIVINYTNRAKGIKKVHPYSVVISSEAIVITIQLEGEDVTSSSSSEVPDIGCDGNIEDVNTTYMLIQSSDTASNIKKLDIDIDDEVLMRLEIIQVRLYMIQFLI